MADLRQCLDALEDPHPFSDPAVTEDTQFISREAPGKTKTLAEDEIQNWSAREFAEKAGKSLFVVQGVGPHPKSAQRLLRFGEFGAAERRLLKLIFALSRNPKFLRKAAVKSYERAKNFAYIPSEQNLSELAAESGASVDELRTAVRELDLIRINQNVPAVEVGVWRIVLKSGKAFVGVHTSHDPVKIEEAVNKAFNGLADKYGVTFSQVARLEYFHSHPTEIDTANYLSPADETTFLYYLNHFRENGSSASVHMYAIQLEPEPLIFHMGSN